MPDDFTREEESAGTRWVNRPRPDFGGNSRGGGKNVGEVQRSSSRPPWKVRA